MSKAAYCSLFTRVKSIFYISPQVALNIDCLYFCLKRTHYHSLPSQISLVYLMRSMRIMGHDFAKRTINVHLCGLVESSYYPLFYWHWYFVERTFIQGNWQLKIVWVVSFLNSSFVCCPHGHWYPLSTKILFLSKYSSTIQLACVNRIIHSEVGSVTLAGD